MKFTRDEILAHRQEWLAALRSGTYSQTKGYLRTDEGYCCLGVACDVAGIPSERLSTTAWNFGRYRMDQVLPEEGEEWLGVNTANPDIDFPAHGYRNERLNETVYGAVSLAGLNDSGWTFEEIADAIEEFGFVAGDDRLQREAA